MSSEENLSNRSLVPSTTRQLLTKTSSLVKRGLIQAEEMLRLPEPTCAGKMLARAGGLPILPLKGDMTYDNGVPISAYEEVELTFSPDGHYLLASDSGIGMRLWDIANGQELARLVSVTDVESAAFSPDGRDILSGSYDGSIHQWREVANGREFRHYSQFPTQHSGRVVCVAFSPDGLCAISASYHEVYIWIVPFMCELHCFRPPHSHRVTWSAFTPNGPRAISYSHENETILWDVDSGSELLRFEGCIERIALSPDGHYALTCSPFRLSAPDAYGSRRVIESNGDNSFPLWDIENGHEVYRFEGHTDDVCDVAFSFDGRRALSSSFDGTLRLWDVASGRELYCFKPPDGINLNVALSPDGHWAASGGEKVIWLWSLGVNQWR